MGRNLKRQVFIYIPQSVCDRVDANGNIKVSPAVVVFHCYGCSGNKQSRMFLQQSEEYGMVVIAPEGLQHSWNAHECCGYALENSIDDIGFVEKVVNMLIPKELPFVSRDALYATGFSNGGYLSSLLALVKGRRLFKAYAPFMGLVEDPILYAAVNSSSLPVPILIQKSTKDRMVKWDGCCKSSNCCCSIGSSVETCTSTDQAFDKWLTANGCTGVKILPFTGTQVGENNLTLMANYCMHGVSCDAPTILCKGDDFHSEQAFARFVPRVVEFFMLDACEVNSTFVSCEPNEPAQNNDLSASKGSVLVYVYIFIVVFVCLLCKQRRHFMYDRVSQE
eukprot:CAMPEP_0203764876 /NCGR_PEP_ID=MMETSP0098-20131031/18103_1 /ASSEMBLY_ACC=CAM_ASM_000208 /TAXON_ID=96639 /ORGANISM=" , Strain NY0313808BC1" /LENGTH=334 /DNA_ID=CAMNT_0050661077 /DNA_START=2732 /DNA_END=3736 /DNA_ORIENTATION=-